MEDRGVVTRSKQLLLRVRIRVSIRSVYGSIYGSIYGSVICLEGGANGRFCQGGEAGEGEGLGYGEGQG